MNDVVALALILLLATSGYAAGRVHGQFGYRMGYRYGYRQGYFDGDRASWTRRRRDLQAAVAAVLKSPFEVRPEAHPDHTVGTTYTSTAQGDAEDEPLEVSATDPVEVSTTEPVVVPASDRARGRHSRSDRAMADVGSDG